MGTFREQKALKVDFSRRGDVYLVNFDPALGHEIKKTRPALIIQNDIGNKYSSLTIVAPITSRVSPVPYPVEVIIEPASTNSLRVRSAVRLDQIRTVDHRRLERRLGHLDSGTMRRVDEALKISLGLVEF